MKTPDGPETEPEPLLSRRDRARLRPGSLFRGNELRGLIVFAVVMAIGWPIILGYARPKSSPEPPPRVVDRRPIEPDTGLAFAGLLDKTPMGFRDNAAYRLLLERARSTPADELARVSRRDLLYTQLWERPDLYRGVPVHVEGTLLRTLVHERMNPELAPGGRAVECWLTTPESRPFPYVVIVEDPPPGLPIGPDLNERVTVDAYFFRLLGYRAGDANRAAPLLVGRLRRLSADPATGAPAGEGSRNRWSVPVIAVVASLVVYIAFRLTFSVRRALAPSRSRPTRSSMASDSPRESIDPEALRAWLANAADEDDRRP